MGRSEEYAAVIDIFFVMMFVFVLILFDFLEEILSL